MDNSVNETSWVVQKHWRATQEKIEKFLSDTYFVDVNLRGRLYLERASIQSLKWYKASGRIPYRDAVEALQGAKEVLGQSISIGPAWTTHWFKCDMTVPSSWAGKQVRFRWDSNSEAMVWQDGKPAQGLTGSSDTHQLRTDFVLTKCAQGGERYILYVEVGANGMFGAGNGLINPPDEGKHFQLSLVEIAIFNQSAYDLMMDLQVLYDMSKQLSRDSPRAYEALYTANDIINVCNPFDENTFPRCRAIAAKFFAEKNGNSQHVIHVMGHCHIDSAWLWPYEETIRKCGRSWASMVRLMEDYPEFTFVCSQAQQLEWVKVKYPSLYMKIKSKALGGQFIPVGGTWIEMDGNIPSGESFVRQFLVGQRFFKQEFGHYCVEFWLPDTFGYSAQLPQIMNGAGIKYFLTQKLSWNLTNKFPHNTFLWEGIDGSNCVAHFPPADTYESRANVEDVLKTVKQFKDKGRSRHSVLLYGHGDGGGGPTEDMLESLKRIKNIDGLPITTDSTPEKFFSSLEAEGYQTKLCKWVGELYLELHRGTYTTHAKLKKENRKGEFLLHDVDFISALSHSFLQDVGRVEAVRSAMLPLWKKFLLNQFHDVLPGSCIEQVAKDSLAYYEEVKLGASEVLTKEVDVVLSKVWNKTTSEHLMILNTFSWSRREVVRLKQESNNGGDGGDGGEGGDGGGPRESKRAKVEDERVQTLHDGSQVALVSSEPMSIQLLQMDLPKRPASVTMKAGGDCVLENEHLRAVVTKDGLLQSLILKESSHEAIGPGSVGNQFVMFDDVPLFWDAWDVMEYHLETRKPIHCDSRATICVIDTGPLRVSVQIDLSISKHSSITQEIILDADSPFLRFDTKVKWHEMHKFLKVEFPFNVRSHEAKYEIQFGHVSRPTHFNTSWDQAKFEVCGHKWADLSEHGFGVAVLNDCKYGYSTLDNVMRLSLLRSPKAPDKNADMGTHFFTYAVMPHKGTLQEAGVIQEGYNLNHPLKIISTQYTGPNTSFFSLDNPAVVLDTVKPVEEGSGLVLRLYEAFGGLTAVKLMSQFPFKTYQRCNLLEEPLESPSLFDGNTFSCQLKPFEIFSVIFKF